MWHYNALYMLLIMAYYDSSIAIVQRQHDMYHCNDSVNIQSTRQPAGLSGSDSRRLARSWRWENCLGPQFLPVVCFVFRRLKNLLPKIHCCIIIWVCHCWVYFLGIFATSQTWLAFRGRWLVVWTDQTCGSGSGWPPWQTNGLSGAACRQ